MVFLKNTNLLILHGSQGQQLLLKQICPKEVHGRHDKVKEIFSYNTECSVGNKFWAVHPDTSTYNMNKGFKLTKSNFFHPLILSIAVIMLRNFTPFEIQPNKFSRNHNYIKYWKYYHHFSVTDKNQWNINLLISYRKNVSVKPLIYIMGLLNQRLYFIYFYACKYANALAMFDISIELA